jgi:large subunit ribosomal protein L17
MSSSLILHKRINTTLAKAKALRIHVEPILTRSKDNTTHSRRMVFSELQNKDVVNELFDVVAPKIFDRPGGYCRIIKTGFRKGDGAETAMIELVDFNEVMKAKTGSSKATTRRSRRKSGGNTGETVAAVASSAAVGAPIVANDAKSEEE